MRRFERKTTFHSDYLQRKTVVVHSIESSSSFTVKYQAEEGRFQNVEQIINCRLANLVPKNGKYWTRDAVKYFKEIAMNESFTIEILKQIDDIFFINLNDFDLMMSVDQCLVDKEYAVYENSSFAPYFPCAS